MSERVNRRDQIVEVASDLFVQNGYNATSIRQIADAVGVTEAAIYYHFKDGKRELFAAVVECQMPDYKGVLDECKGVQSLAELLECFGTRMLSLVEVTNRAERFRWIMAEIDKLSPDEIATLHSKHLNLNYELTNIISRFIPDIEQARKTAWFIVCCGFGYVQLFHTLRLKNATDFRGSDLLEIGTALFSFQPEQR